MRGTHRDEPTQSADRLPSAPRPVLPDQHAYIGLVQVIAEFTIEPFTDGDPGTHVIAALTSLADAGLTVDMGPFGSSVRGEAVVVIPALADALSAALGAGATTVSLQVSVP